MKIRLEFKLQDLWIGVFWRHTPVDPFGEERFGLITEVWICLLPCLPIHITKFRKGKDQLHP